FAAGAAPATQQAATAAKPAAATQMEASAARGKEPAPQPTGTTASASPELVQPAAAAGPAADSKPQAPDKPTHTTVSTTASDTKSQQQKASQQQQPASGKVQPEEPKLAVAEPSIEHIHFTPEALWALIALAGGTLIIRDVFFR